MVKRNSLPNKSSHSYRVSFAIWYHTVLPSIRHKWTHPILTQARQASTRFTYTWGMEGWVDLDDRLHTEMVYPPADGHPSKYASSQSGVCWTKTTLICTCSSIDTESGAVSIIWDRTGVDNHVVPNVFQVDSVLSVVAGDRVVHIELIPCIWNKWCNSELPVN